MLFRTLAAAVLLALAAPAAAADADILQLRERIRAAAGARDKAALDALLAENFFHQRDGGRTDLKGERVALLASGEPTIETVAEDELQLALFGEAAATATGVSRIRDAETSRLVSYRWLAVYARIDGRWRLAASEAHRAR
jgi:hypothetical protein